MKRWMYLHHTEQGTRIGSSTHELPEGAEPPESYVGPVVEGEREFEWTLINVGTWWASYSGKVN